MIGLQGLGDVRKSLDNQEGDIGVGRNAAIDALLMILRQAAGHVR